MNSIGGPETLRHRPPPNRMPRGPPEWPHFANVLRRENLARFGDAAIALLHVKAKRHAADQYERTAPHNEERRGKRDDETDDTCHDEDRIPELRTHFETAAVFVDEAANPHPGDKESHHQDERDAAEVFAHAGRLVFRISPVEGDRTGRNRWTCSPGWRKTTSRPSRSTSSASPASRRLFPRSLQRCGQRDQERKQSASIPAQELTRLRGFTRDFSLIRQPDERVASQNGGTLHVDALDHHFQLFDVR